VAGSFDITIRYGLDGPGIESQWERVKHPCIPALGLTQPPVQGYLLSLRAVKRPGRDAALRRLTPLLLSHADVKEK
jgi:hypothetical protein